MDHRLEANTSFGIIVFIQRALTNRKKNMGLVNMQNQSMNLVLSTDAKPRLKWTQELHQRFVEAVNQLGGADKATPKTVMRVMGIPGLTLYHLKSHLQKFRLGKSQQSQTSIEIKQEDYKEIQSSDDPVNSGTDFKEIQTHDGTVNSRNEDGPVNNDSINESLQIAQALQLQMEVQKKLHEQIEVQRHLQLRIEAQGKYLQSVLKKAQETLAGYTCSSPSAVGIEFARAELSKLASMVSDGYPSSSISEVTETGGCSSLVDTERKQLRSTVCSLESSLISSESTGRKDRANAASVELPLMEIHPQDRAWNKRSGSGSVSDGVCVEQPLAKRPKNGEQLRKSGLLVTLDLNSQYQNEFE